MTRRSRSGDYDGDGNSDLAAGVPGQGSANGIGGGVAVIYGTASGLDASGDQLWTQDSPGIKGESEDNEQFGSVNGNHSFT